MEQIVKRQRTPEEIKLFDANTALAWQTRFNELQVRTFEEAYPTKENKSIRSLVQINNHATKTLLFNILTELCQSFNIGFTMSAPQIYEAVNNIVFDFPNFTIRDFKLFLSWASRGDFGKSFNRIDKAVIYEWLNQYADAQFKHVENEHINNKHKFADLRQEDPKLIQLISEAVKGAEKIKEQDKKPIIRELSETDKMIQGWLKEFDEIYREQIKGLPKEPPLKMIKIAGEKFPVDATKYVEIKLMEATS